MFNWRATLFSLTFDSAFKFETDLKFLNCKKSASGFLSRGDNTADFKHVGMQPSRRERLKMLVVVGSKMVMDPRHRTLRTLLQLVP